MSADEDRDDRIALAFERKLQGKRTVVQNRLAELTAHYRSAIQRNKQRGEEELAALEAGEHEAESSEP